jgi:hypothetical protein
MPEARLNLANEGGSWKIDLPDSTDAQKLSEKLQKQVSECTQMKDQWPADANEAAKAISHSVLLAFSSDAAASGSGATGASGTSGSPGSSSGTGSSGSNSGGAGGAGGTSGGSSGSSSGGSSGSGGAGSSGGSSGSSGTSGSTGAGSGATR